jgi:hypothetical protein
MDSLSIIILFQVLDPPSKKREDNDRGGVRDEKREMGYGPSRELGDVFDHIE